MFSKLHNKDLIIFLLIHGVQYSIKLLKYIHSPELPLNFTNKSLDGAVINYCPIPTLMVAIFIQLKKDY